MTPLMVTLMVLLHRPDELYVPTTASQHWLRQLGTSVTGVEDH